MIPKNPTLEEILAVKAKFLAAYLRWLTIPNQIIEIGRTVTQPREEICRLLERSWSKLWQDLSATLHLIGTNYIGPAAAMTRICRENALNMFLWSFSNTTTDIEHLHFVHDYRPKKNAKRLKRDAEAFLSSTPNGLHPIAITQLKNAIAYADGELARANKFPCVGDPNANQNGFANIARAAHGLSSAYGLNADLLAIEVLGYWIECEAVHSGSNSRHLYQPQGDSSEVERNGQITCLARLKDLYPIKSIVTASIGHAFGLEGKLPKPSIVSDLDEVLKEAEKCLANAATAR